MRQNFGVYQFTAKRHKGGMSLQEIKTRILSAEKQAGRPVGSVQLIAVSKVQPNARVQAILEQGHRLFGENKIQEAKRRLHLGY